MFKSVSTVLLLVLFTCISFKSTYAKTVRALFIGNSYTGTNDLPNLVKQFAVASGDTLVYASNTPGGYTFNQQTTNATTIALIQQGNWDVVVLQEQSQMPSFPDGQVQNQVYPFAAKLDSLIKVSNPCARTMFYVTWGRKNGDASNCSFFPPVCTYQGMDSLLQLRYTKMAEMNQSSISPVAMVWRNLRNTQPNMDLYVNDESHPSLMGSYAAAATFYTMLFEKNPSAINYTAGLDPNKAQIIRDAARTVVYDSLVFWNRFLPAGNVEANFDHTITNFTVNFTNTTAGASTYLWNFGDGNSSSVVNPNHTYAAAGTYTVSLSAKDCSNSDTKTQIITIAPVSISSMPQSIFSINPIPAKDKIWITNSTATQLLSAQLIDINGKIFSLQIADNLTIDVQHFPDGVYSLQLQTRIGTYQHKIVIQH